MSFFSTVEMKVKDLAIFEESCKKHQVKFEKNTNPKMQMQGFPVYAKLIDQGNGSGHERQGFLVQDGDEYRVIVDNDMNWSSLSKRLGASGGKLTRDYTVGVIEKGVTRNGGMINSRIENPDGSVILKVSNM